MKPALLQDGTFRQQADPLNGRFTQDARFSLRTDARHRAQLDYDSRGAELRLDGRWLGRIEGGAARLVTGESGKLLFLVSIDERAQELRLVTPDHPSRQIRLAPGAQVALTIGENK